MKKRTLLLLLFVLTCLLLCSCRGKSAVLTVNGVKIDGAEYAFYLNFNRLRLFDHQSGYTNSELNEAKTAAARQIATAEVISTKCRELGLEPSGAQKLELSREKAELTDALGGEKQFKRYLKDSCLTLRTYDRLRTNELYYGLLTEHYAEQNSAKYTEDYLRDYYADNYILIKYVRLSLLTDDGERVSAKEEVKLRELARDVSLKAAAGEDFDTLIYRYSDDRTVPGGSEGVIISRQAGKDVPYIRAAFELKNGGTSSVVVQSDGLYIVCRRKADMEFFASNTDSIRATAAEEDLAAMVDEWTNSATVTFKKRADKINFANLRKYAK